MNSIYHEKQEGSLCAVHCLNALLQSSYFSAVDLAALASHMDSEERDRMSEHGTHTTEYRNFFRDGSSNNMDDSGMFSIQVMSAALEVFSLQLIPYTSTVATAACAARDDPISANAYICNMKEHWFTIRKLGFQWFNLNSLLAYPELLSDTYVALFLAQLQAQGYSIHIVEGSLPPCAAEKQLRMQPATQAVKPPLLSEMEHQSGGRGMSTPSGGSGPGTNTQEDDDIAAAVAASLADTGGGGGIEERPSPEGDEDEDEELERALQISLTDHLTSVPNVTAAAEEGTERALHSSGIDPVAPNCITNYEDEEARLLIEALKLSLEEQQEELVSAASTPDEETVRQKRLAFFEKQKKKEEDGDHNS